MPAFHFDFVISPSSRWPLLPGSNPTSLILHHNTEEEASPFPLFATRVAVSWTASILSKFSYLFVLACINYTN